MKKRKKTSLVTAGYERQGSENMSLRLLAGAAEQAGFTVSICTAGSFATAPAALEDAITSEPTVLGFVLQDPHSAIHSLALAELARKRGYKGYIICAGELATLQPGLILERAPSVDGVIRHSGVIPMTELLCALEEGDDLSRVSCLHTREFENPPGLKISAPTWRPIRGERPTVMGVKTAEVIASRGCAARCEYCTHAAAEAMSVREVLHVASSAKVTKAGLGGRRRRDTRDLADEMAELYYDKGVRHFGFADENVVPLSEPAALDWAGGFKEALMARDMTDVSLGFMTRADALTEPVADALVDLGLIRTLAGVESGNQYGLASLGRNGNAGKGRQGLNLLVERKVVTLFNDIVFHPETTVASIRDELRFLREVRGALFDTVQAVPFIGTGLGDRMANEGRLTGGRMLPTFIVNDPVLERFRALLTRLQTQVFGSYNPTLRANDLLFSAALACRHGDHKRRSGEIAIHLGILADCINLARVDTLEEILNAALRGSPENSVIDAAKERFSAIARELDKAAIMLNSLSEPNTPFTHPTDLDKGGMSLSKTYLNFAAAAAIVFVLSGTTGCRRAAPVSNDTDKTAPGETETADDTATVSDSETVKDSETFKDSETVIDSETESNSALDNCADSEQSAENQQLHDLVRNNCYTVSYLNGIQITIGPDGKVQSVLYPDVPVDDPGVSELINCVQDILEDEEFPCLAGEEVWISLPPIKVVT